jgi:hypothetical protein
MLGCFLREEPHGHRRCHDTFQFLMVLFVRL